MKKNKIILISAIIIFALLCICATLKIKNYITYKKILDIITYSKEQAMSTNNVNITIDFILNGEKNTFTENKTLIKDFKQCDMNNDMVYRFIDFDKNVYYLIEKVDNDKKIYIENTSGKTIRTVEILENLVIPQYTSKNSYTYKIISDSINNKECYKISIYNKNSDVFEYNYWIEKESGLLLKNNLKYYADMKTKINEEEYIYNYNFDTNLEIEEINLNEYLDYEIIDRR